jgi:hypothetical protein
VLGCKSQAQKTSMVNFVRGSKARREIKVIDLVSVIPKLNSVIPKSNSVIPKSNAVIPKLNPPFFVVIFLNRNSIQNQVEFEKLP